MISTIFLVVAVYVVIWWITLFAVLPWGVQSQQEAGDVTRGSERGAPAKPLMKKKLAVTTVISAVILAVGYGLLRSGLIDQYVLPAKYIADRLH